MWSGWLVDSLLFYWTRSVWFLLFCRDDDDDDDDDDVVVVDALGSRRRRALSFTTNTINLLVDVHGFEIFRARVFNADPHPGNILVRLLRACRRKVGPPRV